MKKVLLHKVKNNETKISKNNARGLFLVCFAVCAFVFNNQSKANGNDTLSRYVMAPSVFDTIPGIVADEDEVRAGLLYDIKRNKIVWQKDMDYAYPIASLTKMMVGLLAMEDLAAGNVCLDDHIIVTRTFKKKISRRRFACVMSKEEYSFEDLLKMAMVASHNESTMWIAKHCSGSVDAFVERMNQKAAELGMKKTAYSNTSGLPAVINELDNSASARDMLTLALEVLKYPKMTEITSIPYATVSNGKGHDTYRNHNGLVINYNNEVDGIKTGYTKAARFCLVATSNRGDHRMISIVFGVRSPWVRNSIVASMLNSYYDAIKIGRLGDATPDLAQSRLYLDSVNRGLAVIHPQVEQRHKDTSDESYAYTYKIVTQKIKKPYTVRKGDNLGRIADRNNVAMADLKHWNNLKGSVVRPGQHLNIYTTVSRRVPVKLVVDPDETYADTEKPIENSPECNTEVTVESVSAVADSSLLNKDAQINKPVQAKADIHPKVKKVLAQNAKPTFIYHLVQPGDTLWNIAQRYQATVDQIKKVNKMGRGTFLKSGQRIKIPVKG